MNKDLSISPWVQFQKVFDEAASIVRIDPNAMSLATSDGASFPRVRTVLFKGVVRDGLSFYTNFESSKATDLKLNPQASALFFWRELSQQVRFEGVVDQLTPNESDAYFATRPRLSQIGAWASEQSRPLLSTQEFQKRITEFEARFKDLKEIPRPPHWGGFRLRPLLVEFWYGKEGRLHERYIYSRENVESDQWQISMRFP